MTIYAFTKFGHTETLDVPDITQSEAYLRDYGIKQSLSDSYASAENITEFKAKLYKRFDAIVAGTVRIAAANVGRNTKSALEKEFARLVGLKVQALLDSKGLKVKKAAREAYEAMFAERFHDDLYIEAEANVAKVSALAEGSAEFFDELFGPKPTAEAESAPEAEAEPVADDIGPAAQDEPESITEVSITEVPTKSRKRS